MNHLRAQRDTSTEINMSEFIDMIKKNADNHGYKVYQDKIVDNHREFNLCTDTYQLYCAHLLNTNELAVSLLIKGRHINIFQEFDIVDTRIKKKQYAYTIHCKSVLQFYTILCKFLKYTKKEDFAEVLCNFLFKKIQQCIEQKPTSADEVLSETIKNDTIEDATFKEKVAEKVALINEATRPEVQIKKVNKESPAALNKITNLEFKHGNADIYFKMQEMNDTFNEIILRDGYIEYIINMLQAFHPYIRLDKSNFNKITPKELKDLIMHIFRNISWKRSLTRGIAQKIKPDMTRTETVRYKGMTNEMIYEITGFRFASIYKTNIKVFEAIATFIETYYPEIIE